MVGMMSSRPR